MEPDPANAAHSLQFSVQFAVQAAELPSRQRLRAWARRAQLGPVSAVLRIVDAEEALQLNRDFRGRDYATNVLTFPYGQDVDGRHSGDIALCWPVVCREAAEQHKSIEAHCAHLVVHGMLHLQGLDHVEEEHAAKMEDLETRILAKLGHPDPYLMREDARK